MAVYCYFVLHWSHFHLLTGFTAGGAGFVFEIAATIAATASASMQGAGAGLRRAKKPSKNAVESSPRCMASSFRTSVKKDRLVRIPPTLYSVSARFRRFMAVVRSGAHATS